MSVASSRRAARRRNRLLAQGLCGICGSAKQSDTYRCEQCILKNREVCRAFRQKMRANGLCTQCGEPSVEKSRCPLCMSDASRVSTERKRRLKESGRCTDCAGPNPDGGWACPDCRLRRKLREHGVESRGPVHPDPVAAPKEVESGS